MTSPAILDVQRAGSVLYVTLNQPATRNALSARMVAELREAARLCARDTGVRCVVLRGAGGNFCAGGNLGDFQQMMQSQPVAGAPDPIALANREFGYLLQEWKALPQVLVAVIEGAAIGGGLGLATVCDLVLAEAGAKFAMPEASLGLPPAQIAPFVALRIGAARTRRMALTAARLSAAGAMACGLVDQVLTGADALDGALHKTLAEVLRCAPGALASTKAILARHDGQRSLDDTLDFAAQQFATALRSGEAAEGVHAFGEKRAAAWTERPR